MGGLEALSSLLWSPTYVGVLIACVVGIGLFLRGIAPRAFSAVGAWNVAKGGLLVLGWVLVISLIKEGVSTSALLAFSIAAYFSLIGAVVLCLPAAMVLVSLHRYQLLWFIVAGQACVLVVALVAEVLVGPEANNGLARWEGSILALVMYCGPAILAFAIGARIPLLRRPSIGS